MLVIYESLCPALKDLHMDYVVGGVAALLMFAYLLYALLKPEKF